METSQKYDLGLGAAVRTVMATLAVATMLGGMSTGTARADDRDHWDRGRHEEHRDRDHDRWRHEHRVYERPQGYYVAPPPVVYEESEPGINFVFPLHIR